MTLLDRQLVLPTFGCHLTELCVAADLCGEQTTEFACAPEYSAWMNKADVMHPLRPDALLRVTECRGLELNVPAQQQAIPVLPRYVPQVRLSRYVNDFGNLEAVAIPLPQVRHLEKCCPLGRHLKEVLGLSPHQVLVLTGFAHDRVLEKWWPLPTRRHIINSIKRLGVALAVAWDYSVWYRDSFGNKYTRFEHLYNMKRSLVVYGELQHAGIPSAPHVFWFSRLDLQRWSTWLQRNPRVSLIAIDLQTVNSSEAWSTITSGLRYLHASLDRDVVCLFNGVGQDDRVRELRTLWPNCVLTNCQPYFDAAFAQEYSLALRRHGRVPKSRDRNGLFRSSVAYYERLMGSCARCHLPAGAVVKGAEGEDE